MINCFYRISDKSYQKIKMPGATKDFCLKNFLEHFGDEKITIIADNCNSERLDALYALPYEIIETTLGNAGSAITAIELACELDDNEVVYLAEDDYLYRDDCVSLIQEGLQHALYVTLYDHPDKYQSEYKFGETSKVFRTLHSHWRHTISTTMTCASKAKYLKDDLDIWKKYTNKTHPIDHLIFCEIAEKYKDIVALAVSIPGRAYHVDLTYPLQKKDLTMLDGWAVEMVNQFS